MFPHAAGANLRELVVKAGGSDDRRELSRTIQFPKQETDGNTIRLEGRKTVVDAIVAQIEALVGQRKSQVTEVLDVPADKHRLLIGRGGESKRQMEAQFAVTVDVPRQGGGQDVKITGQPADVEKAKAHILARLKEHQHQQHSETVQVPRALHHAVSAGGQFFRNARADYGVTVDHAGQAPPPRPQQPALSSSSPGGAANGDKAALPLITVLSLFWLQLDGKTNHDLTTFVTGVLYGLVPTAAILVTLMFTLQAGLPLAVCLLLGVVVWAVVTLLARFLGIL